MPHHNTYCLTPMQAGMFLHTLAAPHSGDDVEQVIGTLHEALNLPAFKQAWQCLVDRHEALRMRFSLDEKGNARQHPLAEVTLRFDEHDWAHWPPEEQAKKLEAFLQEDRRRGFDPRAELPIRIALFRCGAMDHRFVWTWWHGILDGRARLSLMRELFQYYEAFRKNETCELPRPRRYTDYTEWLARHNASQAPAATTYWKELLAGFSEPNPIGKEPLTISSQTVRYGRQEMRVSAEMTSRLGEFAQTHDVTMNTLLLGAWALVLAEFSGQDDVLFGNTRACRRSAFDGDGAGDGIIGALINTVPVRVRLRPDIRVVAWLKELRNQLVAVRPYELTPLVTVQAGSEVRPNQRLFDSLVVYENQLLNSTLRSPGGSWTNRHFDLRGQTGFPLTIFGYGEPELLIGIHNDRTRVDDETVALMLGHLAGAMRLLVGQPDATVTSLSLLTEAERRRLLEEFNDTAADYPADRRFHELFEAQVEQRPEAPAVIFEEQEVSYRELNRRVNQLAHHLRALGTGPDVLVGICVNRSVEMVVAVLGVLKAGGAYVPLDPAYPPDRLAFMLQDSQAKFLITRKSLRGLLPETGQVVVDLDADAEVIGRADRSNPAIQLTGKELAYVIYTSGSTGRPKGVQIQRGSIVGHCLDIQRVYELKPADRVLQFFSLNFDPSAEHILSTLMSGACLVLRGDEVWSVAELFQKIIRLGITVAYLPTAYWHQLVHAAASAEDWLANHRLRLVTCGGEAMLPEAVAVWQKTSLKSARLYNVYGPTETTVTATVYEITPPAPGQPVPARIPIGRPLGNRKVYVLDKYLKPVPLGVPEELHIGGAGLARGYLNRPELTAERFVPDPFSSEPGARLYKTGDYVRFLGDGNLEFLGRIDNQVKVRGFRIELGEIEAVLNQHPSVRQVAVIVREDVPGDKRLVAYLVTDQPAPPAAALKEFLKQKLPDYMTPSAFVALESFPMTPNGKVNRRALPPPGNHPDQSAAPERTATPLETSLMEIWRETLKQEHIGLDDDFFEIGGNSLSAINLLLLIGQKLGVEMPLQALIDAPTVARLAGQLRERLEQSRPTTATVSGAGGPLAPRTATERRLQAMWERLLNASPIGIRDSFFGFQANPRLLDRMFIEIKTEFGSLSERVPANDFLAEPTIEALARYLDGNTQSVASQVVCLQPRGSNPPLFLIHDGGSNVFLYRPLALRLAPDQPVYGIRAETNRDGLPIYQHQRIEDVAAHYLTVLKTAQPQGPYILGGGCTGGLIAFEMARQLRSQGEAVIDPVLIFDSFVHHNRRLRRDERITILQNATVLPPPSRWTVERRRLKKRWQESSPLELAKSAGNYSVKVMRRVPAATAFLLLALTGRLRGLPAQLAGRFASKKASPPAPPESVAMMQERLLGEFLKASARLQSKYAPRVYPGKIALFRAIDSTDPLRLWTGLARDGMVAPELPGVHLEMLEEPSVNLTAPLVSDILRGALGTPAATKQPTH